MAVRGTGGDDPRGVRAGEARPPVVERVAFDAFAFAEEVLRPAREVASFGDKILDAFADLRAEIARHLDEVSAGRTFEAREKARYALGRDLGKRARELLDLVLAGCGPGIEAEVEVWVNEGIRATIAAGMAFL